MTRKQCLEAAAQAVLKDRHETHGPPEDSFALLAKFWTCWLGVTILPHDVAIMLGLLKVTRLKHNPGHEDSWVDLCGYACCGAQVAQMPLNATSEASDASQLTLNMETAEKAHDASEGPERGKEEFTSYANKSMTTAMNQKSSPPVNPTANVEREQLRRAKARISSLTDRLDLCLDEFVRIQISV